MSHVSCSIVAFDSEDDAFNQLFPPQFVSFPPLENTLSSDHVSKAKDLPPMSENAEALLGGKDLVNTIRNSHVGMRSFAKYLCSFEGTEVDPSNSDDLL